MKLLFHNKSLFLVLALLLPLASVQAHESRPAYLEIKQTSDTRYNVLWRTPVNSGMRLPVALRFPDEVRNVTEPLVQELSDSLIERRLIEVNGFVGKRVEILGLQTTIIEVLVRLERLDGTTQVTRLTPSSPSFVVEALPGTSQVAAAYLGLGMEHILSGIDHLLYILAMLMLVKGWRRVILTMSAFTATHSLTLTAAALGWVHVPQAPVEACIALSILFVTSEIVRARQGHSGLTERWPWVVSFTFGLLHGFGFAGALSEVGLPQKDIPVALLFFNLGVEAGQLLFILSIFGIVMLARQATRRLRIPKLSWAWRVPTYAIGAVAAFWFIQRTLAII
ncbi:MAG TPA: HupE/UreJ family protein [Pyrinomonadaceae bacterium]|nr:HupE/UreJ family protein [Pyrinomonadaceae bacterium]